MLLSGTGSRAFNYNADGTLASETIPNILNGSMTYSYDSYLRRTGMQLKQNNTAVYSSSYVYDNMSRIATIGDGTNTAAYTRKPGTNLLDTTTITAGGVAKLTTTRNYDNYYRLTGINSVSSVPSVVKTYSYTYDDKDRRSRLNMADGSYWVYDYDANGQVISGVKHDADDKAIPGQSFGYDYDGIGNLTAERRGVAAMNIAYTANNVNQYTQRTIPGLAPVVGEADPTAAVKAIRTDVRDPAYADTMIIPARDGKYFSGIFRNIANSTAAVNVTYDVYATKNDNANNQQLINKQSGSYVVAKTPQLFSYDNDHNMLSNRSWTYTYNAENRPATAVNASNTAKLEYAYNYDGRRISKKIYAQSGGTWTLTQEIKFVYDGNNLIAEYDGSNTILRNHLWGIDLSGTMDGAGGAGGLLCVTDGTGTYYPAYDGNGNICAYANTTGALAAEYEYSPFGKPAASGAKAADLPFQFSTQYYDKETGTLHYKYREYDLDIMRWTTQDPIGEDGGKNLYGFVLNNPVKYFDLYGLAALKATQGQEECNTCGPDITESLKKVLANVDKTFNSWNNAQKVDAKRFISAEPDPNRKNQPAYRNGWDIMGLAKWTFFNNDETIAQLNYPGCNKGEKCKYTVMVDGKCFYVGSVNYVIFGKMMKLLDKEFPDQAYSRSSIDDFYISPYKGPLSPIQITENIKAKLQGRKPKNVYAPNYEHSVKWANAGYCHRGQTLAIVFLMLDNKLFDDFLIENFSNRLKSNVVLLMLDKYCSPAIFKF